MANVGNNSVRRFVLAENMRKKKAGPGEGTEKVITIQSTLQSN